MVSPHPAVYGQGGKDRGEVPEDAEFVDGARRYEVVEQLEPAQAFG